MPSVQTFLSLLLVLLQALHCVGTVVAAKCSSGVVIGTDSLATQGSLVGNRFLEKVIRVNSLTVLCLATQNSDVRNLCKELRKVAAMHKAHCGEILGTSSLAHVARQLVHDSFPKAHVLVVGGESMRTLGAKECAAIDGLNLPFSIHEVLPGGTRIEQDVAVAGSGSPTIISLMHELWGRPDENASNGAAAGTAAGHEGGAVHSPASKDARETAIRVMRAMKAAIRVDPESGGDVALWLVTPSPRRTVADTMEEDMEGVGSIELKRL